jgi:hypothetical protein
MCAPLVLNSKFERSQLDVPTTVAVADARWVGHDTIHGRAILGAGSPRHHRREARGIERQLAIELRFGVGRQRCPKIGQRLVPVRAPRGMAAAVEELVCRVVWRDHSYARAGFDRHVADRQPAFHRHCADRGAGIFDGTYSMALIRYRRASGSSGGGHNHDDVGSLLGFPVPSSTQYRWPSKTGKRRGCRRWWGSTVDRLPAGLAYCSCKPATGPSRRGARGSASTSAHNSSVIGSCGCDQERYSTASRAWTIAWTNLAISGWLASSTAKLGTVTVHSDRHGL